MKILKVIGNCCLVILAIISLILTLIYGYFYFFGKDSNTTGTNYIDNQVPIDLVDKKDDLSQEEIDYYENRVLFNVNYYSNEKNNGIELQEMNLEYFTDYTLSVSSCRATGMQYIGDFENYVVNENDVGGADKYVVPDFYYYDTTNLISWSGGKVATELNRDFKFTIKIDNKPYLMQLTGKKEKISKFLWWDFVTETIYYDYGSVFYDVLTAVETNSIGHGDFYITLNLSKYFTLYEFDVNTGKYLDNNVADEIFTYAVCRFHYDENGATNSKQSLFGQIECNRNYGITDTSYWQERYVYNLTEKDFNYRYSETYKGYLLSVTQDIKSMFKSMPRAKVNINIDLNSGYYQSNKINVVGLDYNAFENFDIDTLIINGFTQNFYLLEKCLYNTNLQTFKHSENLNLIFSNDVINNEYVEVIL